MKLSLVTLINVKNLGLSIGNEVFDGVYEICKSNKILGVINFKALKRGYLFEDEMSCQIGIIDELLCLLGYKIVDSALEKSGLDFSKFEIFDEKNDDLLLTFGNSGSLEDKKIYVLSDSEISDDNGIILKNRNLYLEDYDIKEELKDISKTLSKFDKIGEFDVYTNYNYNQFYIVNSLKIVYIDFVYREKENGVIYEEKSIYFLYKSNKDIIKRVADYLDFITKKLINKL